MTESQPSAETTSAQRTGVEDEVSTLLSSATLILFGTFLSSGAKLLERILIGRFLSPGLYGEVSIALAILSLGTTLAMAGFSQGIPRYISRVETARERRGVWLSGVLVTGSIALILTFGLSVLIEDVASHLFETSASPQLLQLFVYALPLVVGFKIAIAGIRGHENTIYKTYVGDLLYPGGRVVLLWILLSLGYGIVAAGYAYLCAAGVSLVAAYYFMNKLFPLAGPVETRVREMSRFSAPLVVSTLLSVLLTRTDTMMLGYFRPSVEVGIYSAAYPLATGMLIVLSSFGFMFLPLASRMDADGNREDIDTIYALTTKWIFIVTFPAFLLFVVFSADTLSIFFGAEYERGAFALSILAVGFFSNAIAGRTQEAISALGATMILLVANALVFTLNVVLNLVLIPRFSFVGAAAASAVANIALNGGLYLILWLKLDVTPFSSWSRRTFVVVPLVLLPPVAVLSQWITMTPVLVPVFLIASGIGCLVTVAAAGCLQPEDEIVLAQVENAIGRELPWVREYVPDASGDHVAEET